MHLDVSANHQIFHFIVCTVNSTNWKTNPYDVVVECDNVLNEWPDEGIAIDVCAKDPTISNPYLDVMIAKTGQLSPSLTTGLNLFITIFS